MPGFKSGAGTVYTPFGKNEYLRSTDDVSKDSFTVAASTVTPQIIDGRHGQKILQPGTVLAKITSGPDAGKVGPYQPAAGAGTAEVQTLTGTGTITGGTFTLTFNSQTTPPLANSSSAQNVSDALNALQSIQDVGGVTVTGGPLGTAAFTVTFNTDSNDNQITADASSLTGTTPGITAATGTQGVAGASDGRQTAANIVGLNDTFLPWQLMERDVEVAVAYDANAVQAWCLEYDANGNAVPISNTTAAAMQASGAAGKSVNIIWK